MKAIILEAINEVVTGKGQEALAALKTETRLREDLELDSFDLAELTVRIEEKTGKDIFEDGIVDTVGEILDVLE